MVDFGWRRSTKTILTKKARLIFSGGPFVDD